MLPNPTILHPTDFSAASQAALELACALARDHRTRLILLHVVPGPVRATGREEAAVLRELESGQLDLRAFREEMERRLRQVRLPALPTPAERRIAEGDVATAILRAADDCGADMIVMGTHGRTGEARQLMGSVAEKVMQKARCAVVTTKTPLSEPEPDPEPAPEEMAVIL